jgi:SAM-dependent methyltransferase
LEMSPWLVALSKQTFGVDVLTGPIESQRLEPKSFDVIALFDVLEHFPDPIQTMSKCLEYLKPDGIFVIQTPCYPAGTSYDELLKNRHDFPLQLKPEEHLYLFSENSVRRFFEKIGFAHLNFEPAIFANYDMFFVASRLPLNPLGEQAILDSLLSRPSGRVIQALIDIDDRNPRIKG